MKKKKQRQSKIADDYWEWFPLVCDIETKWCDTGNQLTRAEIDRELKPGAKLERPVTITVRVPLGTETFVAQAGWNLYEADEVIFNAIEMRLRQHKKVPSYEQMLEQYELLQSGVWEQEFQIKLPPPKGTALKNRIKKRGLTKVLADLKAQSQKQFRETSPFAQFIRMNRYRWTTVKNPPPGKDSLQDLSWREALDLMKDEGLPVLPSHYRDYGEWYRTFWKRLRSSADSPLA